jgi:hypothetical protein
LDSLLLNEGSDFPLIQNRPFSRLERGYPAREAGTAGGFIVGARGRPEWRLLAPEECVVLRSRNFV